MKDASSLGVKGCGVFIVDEGQNFTAKMGKRVDFCRTHGKLFVERVFKTADNEIDSDVWSSARKISWLYQQIGSRFESALGSGSTAG
jgi:hypothetical protein